MPFSRLSLSRSPYHMGLTQLNSWVLPHPPVFVEQMDVRAVCSGMSCPFQRILKKVTGRAVVEGDGRIRSNIARSWRENHPWVLGGKREADFYFGFFFCPQTIADTNNVPRAPWKASPNLPDLTEDPVMWPQPPVRQASPPLLCRKARCEHLCPPRKGRAVSKGTRLSWHRADTQPGSTVHFVYSILLDFNVSSQRWVLFVLFVRQCSSVVKVSNFGVRSVWVLILALPLVAV